MAAKFARLAFVAALLLMWGAAWAIPNVLIFRVQTAKAPAEGDYPICDAIANEFQTGGKLNPVVWDITDPIFRTAINDGVAPGNVPIPTLEQATAVASKLHCDYLMAVDIRPDENGLLASTLFLRGSRVIWQDPVYDLGPTERAYKPRLKKKQITQAEYDRAILKASHRTVTIMLGSEYGVQDTLRSVAHSWVEQLNYGPLKDFETAPISSTPDPAKGQSPTEPPVLPTPIAPKTDESWIKDYKAAIDSKDLPKAVLILRDAIDSDPFDPKRRTAFVKELLAMGKPVAAASEARNGAELMPGNTELRTLAARAWLAAGNQEEAQADLNEALARAPESTATRLLLAEVAISKNDPATAMTHLAAILAKGPDPDALYSRAIVYAMTGESAKSSADMIAAKEGGLSFADLDLTERYNLILPVWDATLESLCDDVRTLQQRALVQRKEKEVADSLAALQVKANAFSTFLGNVVPPQSHGKSNARRVLAYKLLTQCLTDLDSYLKGGEEDVLTDSRINLGEALKQLNSSKIAYKEESEAPKGNEKSTGS